jgi:hypothetical protein
VQAACPIPDVLSANTAAAEYAIYTAMAIQILLLKKTAPQSK